MSIQTYRVFLSKSVTESPASDQLLQRLRDAGHTYKWGIDTSCCREDDFHILHSFDQDEFKLLKDVGANVIGTTCALACLRSKPIAPFPRRNVATCCSAMSEVKVLATGFSSVERGQIQERVEWMGGTFAQKTADNPDFIIAKDVSSSKYRWGMSRKKPVVSVSWITQCWSEHRLVSADQHRLPCFSGLHISTTGFRGSVNRTHVQSLITQNGGEYMTELEKTKTTHLVACVGEGQKYKKAKEWGKQVVSLKWVLQCVEAKECLPEENFVVADVGESPSVPKTSEGNISSRSSSLVRGSLSQNSNEAASDGNETKTPNGHSADMGRTKSSDISGESAVSGSQKSKLVSFVEVEKKAFSGDSDDMYLSACRIQLVGLDPVEQKIAGRLITEGGGTRFLEYNDSVTHIVVKELTEGVKSNLQKIDAVGACDIVWATWLRDCMFARQQLEDLTEYRLSFGPKEVVPFWNVNRKADRVSAPSKPLEPKTQHALNDGNNIKELESCRPTKPLPTITEGRSDGDQQQDKSGSSLLPQKRRISNQQVMTDKSNVTNETISQNSEQTKPSVAGNGFFKEPPAANRLKRQKLFEGCSFNFEKSLPDDTRALATKLIKSEGGVLCESSKDLPTYVIGNHGNHSAVGNENVVSHHWLIASQIAERILDPSTHVIFRPLTCQIPLKGFTGFVICVSLYGNQDRELLRNLIFCLGGKMTEKLSRKVTHLLCPYAHGEKFKMASVWGTKVATVEWLYACVAKNSVVSVSEFAPNEPSPSDAAGDVLSTQCPTQAAMLASGRLGELGSQWEPCSQINPSQVLSGLHNSSKGGPAAFRSEQGSFSNSSREPFQKNTHSSLPPKPLEERITDGSPGSLTSGCKKNSIGTSGVGKNVLANSRATGSELEEGVPSYRHDMDSNNSVKSHKHSSEHAHTPMDEGANGMAGKSPPDVADVISKVLLRMQKEEPDTPRAPPERCDLFSPDSVPLNRGTDEIDRTLVAKRNIVWPALNRETESSGRDRTKTNSSPKVDDDYENFQESQLSSQTVGYEEDTTARMQLIEKIQLNSKSEGAASTSAGGQMHWLGVKYGQSKKESLQGLQGLLRAADANK